MRELPTSTLAELLNRARAEQDPSDSFSCGSPALDRLLGTHSDPGLRRGSVAEISGPPGSGKTTLGLLFALDALKRGHRCVWMSHLTPLPLERMAQLTGFSKSHLGSLYHMTIKNLTQLLLLFKERQDIIPESAVLVLDELPISQCRDHKVRAELLRRISAVASSKRLAVAIFSAMGPEYIHNASYFVSQMGNGGWEKYCECRLVLYRDLSIVDDELPINKNGLMHANKYGTQRRVCFEITNTGIVELLVRDPHGGKQQLKNDEMFDVVPQKRRHPIDSSSPSSSSDKDYKHKRYKSDEVVEIPDSQGYEELT